MTPQSNHILLIGSDNPTTWIVYNRLVREFGLFPAIIEEPVARRILLKNRVRKLGLGAVISQLGFIAVIRPILKYQSARRINQLCKRHDLEPDQPLATAITHVENINDPTSLGIIAAHQPKVIIVNGTRILKSATLQASPATFINTHQGITPQYRGAHGGYWALHEKDPNHCGVTVHVVDEGIDTGNVIAQALIQPEPQDSYVTYPYLQTAAALPHLKAAVSAVLDETLTSTTISGASAVWYHPGIWQYLKARLRGVR
jgi:folate-dependent phosphoribosylglycinamide formyltransferase PurN